MEKVDHRQRIGLQYKSMANAQLCELELHCFLVDVVSIHVEDLAASAIHVKVLFVCKRPPISTKVDQVLNIC